MMVATATLATAEPDSLSPELDTPPASNSSSDGGGIAMKPRRPTSLVIATSRSRAAASNGTQALLGLSNGVTMTSSSINQTTSNINQHGCNALGNNNPVSESLSHASITNNIGGRNNSNKNNNIAPSSGFNNARNNQHRSSLSAFVSSYSGSGKCKEPPSTSTSSNNNNTSSSSSMSTDHEVTCFTSLLTAAHQQRNHAPLASSSSSTTTGGSHDESLEYASVTYRYLKQMDAGKNDGRKNGTSSNGKVPSYARSMMCLNENKNPNAPDESIVSVPCPQPSSACPTPAAIRTSLRRRHSDLNLSSIANFLRTRFSSHDDTIQPKPGENGSSGEDDDFLKKPLLRRNVKKQHEEKGGSKNSENDSNTTDGHNQRAHKASPAHHSLTMNGGNNSNNKTSCPHPNCSNNVANATSGSSAWRRPCFRCKNHLIEAILESDATEV